jgi:hypothetical protein
MHKTDNVMHGDVHNDIKLPFWDITKLFHFFACYLELCHCTLTAHAIVTHWILKENATTKAMKTESYSSS